MKKTILFASCIAFILLASACTQYQWVPIPGVTVPDDDNTPVVTPSGEPVATEEALTAAIEAGKDVYLTAPIKMTKALSIPEGVTINGNGQTLTIDSNATPDAEGHFVSIRSNNVTIEDLNIIYNGSVKGSSNHIIKIAGTAPETPATGITLKDVSIDGKGNAAGLNLTGTSNVMLTNVTVKDTKNVPLAISKSTNVIINGGDYDNGELSLGGGDYKFADIQINWEPDNVWQGNCTVTFNNIPEDVVVYATTDKDGKTADHTINGLGEGKYYPSASEGGMYYQADPSWNWTGLSFNTEGDKEYFHDSFYNWEEGQKAPTVTEGSMTPNQDYFANFWMNINGMNTMEVGKSYRISFRVTGASSSNNLDCSLQLYDGNTNIDTWPITITDDGWKTVTFKYNARNEYTDVKLIETNTEKTIERSSNKITEDTNTIYGQFVFNKNDSVKIDDFCFEEIQ